MDRYLEPINEARIRPHVQVAMARNTFIAAYIRDLIVALRAYKRGATGKALSTYLGVFTAQWAIASKHICSAAHVEYGYCTTDGRKDYVQVAFRSTHPSNRDPQAYRDFSDAPRFSVYSPLGITAAIDYQSLEARRNLALSDNETLRPYADTTLLSDVVRDYNAALFRLKEVCAGMKTYPLSIFFRDHQL